MAARYMSRQTSSGAGNIFSRIHENNFIYIHKYMHAYEIIEKDADPWCLWREISIQHLCMKIFTRYVFKNNIFE